MKGMKIRNEYARGFGELYQSTPKAVFAAVAFSQLSVGGDRPEDAVEGLLNEWRVLYENGIVPQKPPKESK